MTQKSKTSKTFTRTFSKRATAWSLVGIYVLAFYGLSVSASDLPEVLGVVGAVSVALLILYQVVGHKDYLITLISHGLLDLRRKRGPDV